MDWFQGKGVGFSATECAPKEKHKPTGQGTQLLLDITDVVWKIEKYPSMNILPQFLAEGTYIIPRLL